MLTLTAMELTDLDSPAGDPVEERAVAESERHLSSQAIELLLVSALPPAEANSAKLHLDACEACRARWRALNEDRARPERELPAAGTNHATSDRLRLWAVLVSATAAVTFAWAGGMSRGAFGTSVPAPGVEVRRAASGQLTASVRGDGARYLLLFARQAGAPWTLAWPVEGKVSGPLARRGRTAPDLPPAVVEVLGVFSDGPLKRAVVERALQGDPAHPDLPGSWLVRVPMTSPAPGR
jgi:hypothetical protein